MTVHPEVVGKSTAYTGSSLHSAGSPTASGELSSTGPGIPAQGCGSLATNALGWPAPDPCPEGAPEPFLFRLVDRISGALSGRCPIAVLSPRGIGR